MNYEIIKGDNSNYIFSTTHKIITKYGCFENFNEGDYIENFEDVLKAFSKLTWTQLNKSCYQKDPDSKN